MPRSPSILTPTVASSHEIIDEGALPSVVPQRVDSVEAIGSASVSGGRMIVTSPTGRVQEIHMAAVAPSPPSEAPAPKEAVAATGSVVEARSCERSMTTGRFQLDGSSGQKYVSLGTYCW